MPHIARINFGGDPNIGLFGFATEKYCLLGIESKKICSKASRVLAVPAYNCRILGTELFGIFSAGNSSGIVIPGIADDDEAEHLKKLSEKIFGEERLLILDTKFAIGNMVLMNDNGMILSPLLRSHKKTLERFFGIPCAVSTIAKLNVVGSLAIATNTGCLIHPKARTQEICFIEKVLGVPVDMGTVSYGSPFPGSGVIANSHGFVVSEQSTGFEAGQIDKALGFV